MPIRTVEYPNLPDCFITANLDRQNNFIDDKTYQAFNIGPAKFEGYQFVSQSGSFSGNLSDFEFSGIYNFQYNMDDYTFHGDMAQNDMGEGLLYNKDNTNKFKFCDYGLATVYLHKLGPKKYKMKIKDMWPYIQFDVLKTEYIYSKLHEFNCPDFDLISYLANLDGYEIITELITVEKYEGVMCIYCNKTNVKFDPDDGEIISLQKVMEVCGLPGRHNPLFFAILALKSPISRAGPGRQ